MDLFFPSMENRTGSVGACVGMEAMEVVSLGLPSINQCWVLIRWGFFKAEPFDIILVWLIAWLTWEAAVMVRKLLRLVSLIMMLTSSSIFFFFFMNDVVDDSIWKKLFLTWRGLLVPVNYVGIQMIEHVLSRALCFQDDKFTICFFLLPAEIIHSLFLTWANVECDHLIEINLEAVWWWRRLHELYNLGHFEHSGVRRTREVPIETKTICLLWLITPYWEIEPRKYKDYSNVSGFISMD